MHYTVVHNTTYEYESPVLHGHHLAHLKPRTTPNQYVSSHSLEIKPEPTSSQLLVDYFGNEAHRFEVLSPHDRLEVISTSRVEIVQRLPHDNVAKIGWEDWAERVRRDSSLISVREFCFDSPLVRSHPSLREYALVTFTRGRELKSALIEFNARINDDFVYETAATDVSTPLATVMREKRGVCQDFAHVAVGCLRSLGLPARYVSGYLETHAPPGKERLVGADASHAWAAAYLPGYGWLDFDPTNNVLPGEQHVTVAWGRDFSDVSPLKGVVLAGGAHRLIVGVDVERTSGHPSPQSAEGQNQPLRGKIEPGLAETAAMPASASETPTPGQAQQQSGEPPISSAS